MSFIFSLKNRDTLILDNLYNQSLDSIVGVSGNRGFVRNTQTGEQFTVRSGFSKKKTIFIPIIACMAFTAAIAMLLR